MSLERKRNTLPFGHNADGKEVERFRLLYQERLGIGANPFDNEEEDIDLLAMIAKNLAYPAFYQAYTKDRVR